MIRLLLLILTVLAWLHGCVDTPHTRKRDQP